MASSIVKVSNNFYFSFSLESTILEIFKLEALSNCNIKSLNKLNYSDSLYYTPDSLRVAMALSAQV